ncbi:nucleotidyltransferase [Methanothermobacter tenebrarum]|jgi:predicted nucleotidyltransferase|uniref:protein adenylyltransferase n=1 Tax=Methanothermobacter tenebrarum TaxID=680118 RepID=A0ABM7YF92_9EURY|nr:nucleotidyltransferase domain-containing protein [Methanothermobacter tenebrarum]MDD3454580.1 nucleotidyltransferase domain-containing protein [Methanobacteriales archaeon]MDX9693760.1 nucleotidyltransferase domain-containing protein [Methanothermobacter sp.]BDH80138.1 nucleotidyltransferase [Methanothermobacter tenebrarum]HOQ20161.1 nucleotidyltransferase domain-containing protein [Methanothermobacter sp.]
MGPEGIEDIRGFLSQVKRKFKPDLILLFGSRARGEHLEDSDYDIIIVSEKFRNMNFLRRIEKIIEYWDAKVNIDVLPYTPEEFEIKKKEIGIVQEAIKEGIRLK